MNSYLLITIAKSATVFAAGFLSWVLISKLLPKKSDKPQQSRFVSALRVMGPNEHGTTHIVTENSCGHVQCSYDSFKWIVDIIDGAESNLDIAMYFISYSRFADAILRAHHRKVKIRIILQHMVSDINAEWVRFGKLGIPIRMRNLPNSELMHQKLVIVDHVLVLFGSMNFTQTAVSENSEEMMRTSAPEIVKKSVFYFNSIWEEMSEHDKFLTRCSSMVSPPTRSH